MEDIKNLRNELERAIKLECQRRGITYDQYFKIEEQSISNEDRLSLYLEKLEETQIVVN